jgi:pimeloyl-ACP methyl ester carboxylesterase
MKFLIRTFGALFAGCVGLWLFGAAKAGLFIRDVDAFASEPGERSMEEFSTSKKFIDVGSWRVACIDSGKGDPVVLLHGCPFQSFEYHKIIPLLARRYRVIAPDLLGLGDTVVRLDEDYRLPNQVQMVVGLLNQLGIDRAHFVGHDHGGAIVQLMMKYHPERLRSVVLTNAEAYDQWPSEPERLDVELVANPFSTPFFRVGIGALLIQRRLLNIAVHQADSLTDEDIQGLFRPSLATAKRWMRLRRFLKWQLDRDHNLETLRAVDGLRRFHSPTLLLWGQRDTNFGPAIAERLQGDIPGVVRIEWLENSAHLPMLEEPEKYASAIYQFLSSDRSPSSEQGLGAGAHR